MLAPANGCYTDRRFYFELAESDGQVFGVFLADDRIIIPPHAAPAPQVVLDFTSFGSNVKLTSSKQILFTGLSNLDSRGGSDLQFIDDFIIEGRLQVYRDDANLPL